MSPLLSFQARFAEDVRDGRKRQTIRALRKDGRDPKPGETLYLWTRLRHRTLPAIKLGERTCTETMGIEIEQVGRQLGLPLSEVVKVTPRPLSSGILEFYSERPLDELARADGFETWDELLAWVDRVHGLPFRGLVIRW